MEEHFEYWDAHAVLAWQVELGVSEAIGETPVNRYELAAQAPKPAAKPEKFEKPKANLVEVDASEVARKAAQSATSLEGLRDSMAAFTHCDLQRGARNLVFGDGSPKASIMIIGDVPSREEDQQGKPFVGQSGALFDQMFAAIGKSRAAPDAEAALYTTCALPWHPPQNRDVSPEEIAMLKPFLLRHIELINPDVIVLMGNGACMALLGKAGVSRLRGKWQTVFGKPAMPMVHPQALLRTPLAKREAWADLLEIQARLREI